MGSGSIIDLTIDKMLIQLTKNMTFEPKNQPNGLTERVVACNFPETGVNFIGHFSRI